MIYGIRKCDYCGKEIQITKKRRLKNKTICCSIECANKLKIQNNLNTICPICGKKFHVSSYYKKKCKNNYCSRKCFAEAKKIYMKGEGNHQYGLKGSKNSSWKFDRKTTYWGYIKVRVLDHPFRDSEDMVFEHRLVAEKYLLNEENSVLIDGKRYLKPEYAVHHIDENKKNNNVENLLVMTKKEHMSYHSKKRYLEKNEGKPKKERKKTFSRKKVKSNCPVCGKEFEHCANSKRVCCSVKCSNILKNRGTRIVKCSNCNKTFKIKDSRLNKSKKNVFCCRDCYTEYRRLASLNRKNC